jgi:hypothetical protein
VLLRDFCLIRRSFSGVHSRRRGVSGVRGGPL